MEETLREFRDIYEDLRILSEYKVELRTKLNKINEETPKEEIDMLNADITSLYDLIQEKIDVINGLESILLEYFEKEGIGKDEDIDALISSEKDIVKYLYEDNNGLERFFEATVLDRDEYNEINKRIHDLERNSKRLQPRIEGSQKSFKKQALIAEGFKEASNGKLIHPSIIEEYDKLLELKSKLDIKYKNSHTLKEKYNDLLDNVKEIDPGLTAEQIAEIINKKRTDLLKDVNEENFEKEGNGETLEETSETEENIEKVRTIEDIEKEIEDLINKTQGRKQFVKFCGKQYYVSRKDVGKLQTLLSELRRRKIDQIDDGYLSYIKNELTKKGLTNEETDLLSVDKLKQLINQNPDVDIIGILIDFINKNKSNVEVDKSEEKVVAMVPYNDQYKNVAMVPYNEEKISSEEKNTAEDVDKNVYFAKGKNDAFEPKTFAHEVKEAKERLKPTTDDSELKRFIDRVTIEQINLHKLFNPNLSLDELIMFLAQEEYRASKTSKVISDALKDNLEDGFEVIEDNSNKNKKFTIKNIKKFTKKHSKKIIAAILATLLATSTFHIISNFLKKKDLEDIDKETIQELEREKEEDRRNDKQKDLDFDVKNTESNENDYDYLIGSKVTVSNLPDVRIYKSTYDAKDNNNPIEPYFDYNDERVILGVTIRCNGLDYNFFSYNEGANKKIEGLLAQGGKVVNVLLGNKFKIEELKDYKGEQMSYEQYMRCAEGWYNTKDINIKESGYTK